ncbi:MAG: J domain-containing protein [Chloroflexi bacterium]|nr:J domain-containing protein [Chloroflexota bacterium]MYD65923.1 J domain-containing protein [Chloroflexota bacterium]
MTQPPAELDPYAILGVPRDATRDAIRQAHRELSAYYASGHAGDDAERKLEDVNAAYEVLSSPSRRRSYDRVRDREPQAAGADAATERRPLGMSMRDEDDREPFAMSWPERREEKFRYELVGENTAHYRTLLRMVLMYGPLTLGALALFMVPLTSLLGGTVGAVIPLLIVGALLIALAFQATMALRDLRSQPLFTRGEVQRTWSKGGLLWFFRSHFVMVNRQVFVVPPEMWVRVGEGEVVEAHHWPHTRTVIRILLLHGSDEELAALDTETPIVPL